MATKKEKDSLGSLMNFFSKKKTSSADGKAKAGRIRAAKKAGY